MFSKLKLKNVENWKLGLAIIACGTYLGITCGVFCGHWEWTPLIVGGVTGAWIAALALIGRRSMAIAVTVALVAAAYLAWVGALVLALVVAVTSVATPLWCFATSVDVESSDRPCDDLSPSV